MLFVFIFSLSGEVVYERYQALQQQDFLAQTANLILANGTVTTPGNIKAAAIAAGLTQSDDLRGMIDNFTGHGNMHVSGWATNTNKNANRGVYGMPVGVAIFQGGSLIDVVLPSASRQDIKDIFHTKMMSYFEFSSDRLCQSNAPLIVVVFSPKKTFKIVQEIQPVCADK